MQRKLLGVQISFEGFLGDFEALFREIGTMYVIQSIAYLFLLPLAIFMAVYGYRVKNACPDLTRERYARNANTALTCEWLRAQRSAPAVRSGFLSSLWLKAPCTYS